MNNKKALVSLGVMWKVIDIFSSQIVTIAFTLYLANILVPSDFGIVGVLSFFLLVGQSVSNSGMQQALIYYGDKATENDFKVAFTFNVIVSTFLYILLYLFSSNIESLFGYKGLAVIADVFFIIIIIESLAIVPKVRLMYALKQKQLTIINAISISISVCVTCVYLFFYNDVWALVIMNLTRSIAFVFGCFVFSRWLPSFSLNKESINRLFSFGSKILITNVLSSASFNLNSLVVGKKYSFQQVGYFQQSANYCNLLSSSITSVIQTVIYPYFSSKNEDEDALKLTYTYSFRLIALISFPLFFGFSAIAEDFIFIFLNSQWVEMVYILMILAISRVFVPLSSVNVNFMNSRGKAKLYLKCELIKFPIAVAIVFLSSYIGLEMVAFGQVIITFIAFILSAYFVGSLINFGVIRQLLTIFPYFISSLSMFLVISNLSYFSWYGIIFKIVLGAFIYFLILFFLKESNVIHFIKRRTIKVL